MKVVKSIFFAILLVTSIFQIKSAQAGPYGDELTKCIVESSSSEDLTVFARWIFSIVALHPAVKSMSSITDKQRDGINKESAELFMRLLTVSCKEQTQKALKYEGQKAIESSFNVFGQVAMRELISNPEVNAGMAGFEKYFDEEKLKSLRSPE